jgi:hypothetical protein
LFAGVLTEVSKSHLFIILFVVGLISRCLQQAYTYLHNHTKRKTNGIEPKVPKIKERAYGQDYWHRDHKDLVVELMAEYRKKNPGILFNVGNRRKILGILFREQPPAVIKKYKDIAKADLAAQKLKASLDSHKRQK